MSIRTLTSSFFLVALLGLYAFGQQQQPAQPAPGDRPDFARMREMMSQRMKEMLGSSDDEWKVLEPKIDKVQKLRGESMAGFGMGMMMLFNRGGGQGGPGGGGGFARAFGGGGDNPSPVVEKTRDLQQLLENKDAAPADLKAKLEALRDAKTKSKAELTKAQDELREVISLRQEALLVTMGMLD